MTDQFADGMLFFSHFPALMIITLIGSSLYGRSLLVQTINLLAIDMIINVALKGTFKLPLPAHISTITYAFPSGHMQLSTVFYVWWTFFIPQKIVKVVTMFIPVGVGASLIHYGYHDLFDVIGGCVVGLILGYGYYCLLTANSKHLPKFFFTSITLLMIYNTLIYSTVPLHAWLSYYMVCVILLIEIYIKKQTRPPLS